LFLIKKAQDKDLPEILEIEKISYPKPWNHEAFKVEISKSKEDAGIFLVSKDEDTSAVLGYITADIITDFVHISNLAVSEKYRKHGIGKALLKELIFMAHKTGIHMFTLEVRQSNEAAITLYKNAGFTAEGLREKFYENTENAVLMWKR